MALKHSLGLATQIQENIPIANRTVTTTLHELEILFGPMFDVYFNGATQVMLKSSNVTTADASDKRQQPNEELHQFKRLDVWELVDKPYGKNVINMKWLWKNKHDEENNVIHNKPRLVAKGYRHDKGIDFKESFAPVSRFEAVRKFIAYVAYKSFSVYHMDVQTGFCKGSIDPTLFIIKHGEDIFFCANLR
ncbi:retrovirus-related pol polyprotein from transposon TNT 1-94 [Tanacetum coccineum]